MTVWKVLKLKKKNAIDIVTLYSKTAPGGKINVQNLNHLAG